MTSLGWVVFHFWNFGERRGTRYSGGHVLDSASRLNRLMRDVYWLRWGRECDDDATDDARMQEIHDWVMRCAPLPYEKSAEEKRRIAILRGYVVLGVQ